MGKNQYSMDEVDNMLMMVQGCYVADGGERRNVSQRGLRRRSRQRAIF